MIKKIIGNKIFVYLASRYGTYGLQFLISLVIAAKLGPYYMGIYGVVLLVISYFAQFHFGIANSLNILLVHHKNDKEKYNSYIYGALSLVSILGLVIISLFVYYWIFGIDYISGLSIDKYLPYICIIAVLEHFDGVFTNILRVKNRVTQLTVIQSLNVICNTSVVFFFNGEDLVKFLVASLMASNILKAIISLSSSIIKRPRINYFSKDIQHEILKKGFYLFTYNSCLTFVLIVARTLISNNYSVEQFGYFSFSFTIANAVMLLLESLSFIIFPKLIDILSSSDMSKITNSLGLIRVLYISTAHLFIYTAMLFFPVLLWLMPQYKESLTSMNLIALTVLMNTNSFGYSMFLLAQNKEKTAAALASNAMIISILFGLLFVKVLNVEFHYVIISTLLTYLIYSTSCMIVSENIIGSKGKISLIKKAFPIRLFVPFSIAIFLSAAEYEELLFLPLSIFLIMNITTIRIIAEYLKKLINDPNISDI